MSWNTKSVRYMKSLGYETEIVEHYSGFSGKKNDFGGYLDGISLNPDAEQKIVGIQITSRSNISARTNKITNIERKNSVTGDLELNPVPAKAKRWLRCGGAIWIIGWETDKERKTKPEDRCGKIRKVYLRDNEFEFEDIEINPEAKIEKRNANRSKSCKKVR